MRVGVGEAQMRYLRLMPMHWYKSNPILPYLLFALLLAIAAIRAQGYATQARDNVKGVPRLQRPPLKPLRAAMGMYVVTHHVWQSSVLCRWR